MSADPAHHAALLAAYLAQFDLTTDRAAEENTLPGYADVPDTDRVVRHQDYHRALHWSRTSTFTDIDVEELETMRRRYGIPRR